VQVFIVWSLCDVVKTKFMYLNQSIGKYSLVRIYIRNTENKCSIAYGSFSLTWNINLPKDYCFHNGWERRTL